MARPGTLVLEAMHDVPEPPALGPLRVRTRCIVEFDAAQEGVQVDLFLRDHPEGLDPRHETGLSRLVRSHPGEFLDVPAGDVHEDRLRGVVEVEARGHVGRVDLAGRAVEGLPTKRPAVAARDRSRRPGADAAPRTRGGLRTDEASGSAGWRATKGSRRTVPRESSPRDPFVDRHPEELDVASVLEEP